MQTTPNELHTHIENKLLVRMEGPKTVFVLGGILTHVTLWSHR